MPATAAKLSWKERLVTTEGSISTMTSPAMLSAGKVDLWRPKARAARKIVTIAADYAFGAGISGEVSVLFVGEQDYFSRTTPTLEARLPGYSLVNLRFEKKIAATRASVFAGADNLLDRGSETSSGLPQAGRFVYAGIDYRI